HGPPISSGGHLPVASTHKGVLPKVFNSFLLGFKNEMRCHQSSPKSYQYQKGLALFSSTKIFLSVVFLASSKGLKLKKSSSISLGIPTRISLFHFLSQNSYK